MATVKSTWISFLRQYGPIPKNDNMYDEAIQRIVNRRKIEPILIEGRFVDDLIENFRSDNPVSVILTGTAGDGKTYHCREVWNALGGTFEEWDKPNEVKVISVGKVTLHIVKDLSALVDDEKKLFVQFFSESVLQKQPNTVYLIAANDGQLIKTFKQNCGTPSTSIVMKRIEDLLVRDDLKYDNFNLRLYNLSRISAAWAFPKIVENLLKHPGWDQCSQCAFKENEDLSQRCPIWENKIRLEGNYNERIIHSRILDLLELCEINGLHLPIRQLLLLVSNMILGHPEARDRLMSCNDVPKILEKRTTSLGSIYRNIFGENLTERRRESSEIFEILGRFGIGNETSNKIDNILIFGADDPELKPLYEELLMSDPFYGADQKYKAEQKAYLEGSSQDDGQAFLKQVRAQRQRLFFEIPRDKVEDLKLWELTTFQYAGEFLNDVYRKVLEDQRVSTHIVSRLVRGLNRIFTGLLTKSQDELFLATSGSNSQAKVSKIFEEKISVPRNRGESVAIKRDDGDSVILKVCLSSSPNVPPVSLKLQLTRYEFLSRVADGALPGSFSRECYEDLLGFKSKLLTNLERRRTEEQEDIDEETQLVIHILRLNVEGMLEKKTVEVNSI
ncbi:hypothetical protein NW801_17330 [Brevibacillus laterosporus]|uniref:DNA phosphorothioation-dependent restriction protein DptF n=2 Tax=Brevibacillus TaxID=55080 RepID=A0A0F7BYR2_BRELA|nr:MULTISPECIES: hypothetical protein [Brevibacillus]AKF92995.1 hypothetical protein EX87_04400 [Brevibacillus laterosporus]MCR8986781.1 hypothetical protein [Brevibacillus laterosporus]MCZ0832517.1 hypothetical protein [Brevibacillus halotolerans]